MNPVYAVLILTSVNTLLAAFAAYQRSFTAREARRKRRKRAEKRAKREAKRALH